MIVGVAIDYKGKIYELPKPARHPDIIKYIHEETGDLNIFGNQGFITDNGEFLDRKKGLEYAISSGQIKDAKKRGLLFSEDLW